MICKNLLVFPAVLNTLLFCLVADGQAQTETNLHVFASGANNGDRPYAGLIQATDGYFYGTTKFGGAQSIGTIFRISADGAYTNVYSFAGSGFDGWEPTGGLVQGTDGNFYGMTSMKGTNGCQCGTIFRVTPGGTYTVIHQFAGGTSDGGSPNSTLIQASDGNFYGTATAGGTGTHGGGVVFRISPAGVYANIYSFGSYANDGYQPMGGVVQGNDGALYGMTFFGGTNNFGTIYRVTTNGTYTSLHSFAGGFYYGNADGHAPYGSLVVGPDGNLYGTASEGGTNTCACGVVFRISPNGNYQTIYSFHDYPDGANPEAGLVLGSDGNFYGTTYAGGSPNFATYGTIFRISPTAQYASLYAFGSEIGQGEPVAPLVQGSDGNFYGTTTLGGSSFRGTVFKLFAALPSPANKVSGVSIAGTNVVITIPSVAGETYQLQYSTNLTSANWSNVPGVPPTYSSGGSLTLVDFGGALFPKRYYRLVITP